MPNEFHNENLPQGQSGEDLHIGLKILIVLIPIVGAVLYFTNRNTYPQKSKSACTFALIGMGVGILLNIILGMGMFATM